jgi:hypothetical protein
MAGIPGCIGGNRWRHNSPHGQQGEGGSAKSYPKYTAHMYSIQGKIDPGMGKKHAIRIALPQRWQNSVCNSYPYHGNR